MLKDVLHVIKMLKQVDNSSDEVKNALEILEQVQSKTKHCLIDLMTVGEIIGYEELQKSLLQMANFIEELKNKDQ